MIGQFLNRVYAFFARSGSGQTTVEFAFVCTSILLFLVGSLDLGRAIYYNNVLAGAVREGARHASVLSNDDWSSSGNTPGVYTTTAPYVGTATVVGAVASQSPGLTLGDLRATIAAPLGTASGFDLPVSVSAQYVYHPAASVLLGIGPITITAQSTMQIH